MCISDQCIPVYALLVYVDGFGDKVRIYYMSCVYNFGIFLCLIILCVISEYLQLLRVYIKLFCLFDCPLMDLSWHNFGSFIILVEKNVASCQFPNFCEQLFLMLLEFILVWCAYRDHLAIYAQSHPAKFILGYCSTYIFMQTFMIPGTIFMSLLAGALFGVVRGLFLVVFNATAGASSCYFLSKLIGRPIVNWLWPEKLRYFQSEVCILFSL